MAMADQPEQPWGALSSDGLSIFEWAAAASKGQPISTRAVLVGLLRASDEKGQVDYLLRHFSVSANDIYRMLQSVDETLDIMVPAPTSLPQQPPLTDGVHRILGEAGELQVEAKRDAIDSDCILGAFLRTESTGRNSLWNAIPNIGIDDIADHFRVWMINGNGNYELALERAFPTRSGEAPPTVSTPPPATQGAPASAGTPTATPTDASATAPPAPVEEGAAPAADFTGWPFLVSIYGSRAGTGAYRAGGLGLLIGDSIVTATPRSRIDVVTLASADTFSVADAGLRFGRSADWLRTLSFSEPLAFRPEPPLIETAVAGSECTLAALPPDGSEPMMLHATIAAGDHSAGGSFTILLTDPVPEGHVVAGSPVLVGTDRVVGIIRDSAPSGETTLSAFGSLALTDILTESVPLGTAIGAGNDAVAEQDQLEFHHYVDAFAHLIRSPDLRPPLTIGIFGSWGTGKSFLLNHIKERIAQLQERERAAGWPRRGPDIYTVTFNAWEYSSAAAIWPALAHNIVERLDRLKTVPRRKRLWRRFLWNVGRQFRSLRLQIFAALLVIAFGTALATVLRGPLAGLISLGGLLTVGGLAKAAHDPLANSVVGLFAKNEYGPNTPHMDEIKHDLDELVERLYAPSPGKDASGRPIRGAQLGRILVIIDDLDRCEPEKAVEVLQAVNLLLNFESFIVCLGIDARIITAAVEKHYEGLLGPAGASGYEYLDKIVQIPFRIPEPTDAQIRSFIGSQMGIAPPAAATPIPAATTTAPTDPTPVPATGQSQASTAADPAPRRRAAPSDASDASDGASESPLTIGASAADGTPRPPRAGQKFGADPAGGTASDYPAPIPFTADELAAFQLFSAYLRPNPRHLKRLINVYRLVRTLSAAKGETLIQTRPAAVIRWLVMWGQWPSTSLLMLHTLDQCSEEEIRALERDEVDPLVTMLQRVTRPSDHPLRADHDDDLRRLSGLLHVDGCRLSVDEIHSIRKYTLNFNPAVEEQLGRVAEPK
ncbi:KAP family P-loop domain-containing protein [Frankineae bacterium MT45]|nr:KAP family P-loop domain-containing protein [Frankineae bacterium MT45]